MKSIRLGLIIITICAVLIVIAGVQIGLWQNQAAQLSVEQEVISGRMAQARSATEASLDIETGQRGYLLTGKEVYLEPYHQGLRDLDLALKRLQEQFSGNKEKLDKIDAIAKLAEAKKGELARTIQLRRNQGLDAAVEVVQTDVGRRTMDLLRDQLSAFVTELRNERSALIRKTSEKFRDVLMLGVLVMALVMFLVIVALQRLSVSIRHLDQLQRLREREAMHDALTALPNRRYLEEWLRITVATARRTGQALAILYFDLDGFKAVNDRFGHEAGDRVLQATAGRLQACMRTSDFVARLGGDEFVAVLADTPAPSAFSMLLERLKTELAKSPIPELADGAISASIGIAKFPEDGETADDLLSAADRAMYEIKQNRPRLVVPARAATG